MKLPDKVIDAGCEVLYDHIAEAYEPRWRGVLVEIFAAMLKADTAINMAGFSDETLAEFKEMEAAQNAIRVAKQATGDE
jgi:hypothetical protein